MSLSKLSARCQACPFADACDKKEMEALGFLPLPEQASQPTEAGYRNVENIWDNPNVLIGTDQSSGGLVQASGEINIDVEKAKKWLANGAQPTEIVSKIFKIAGIEK